MSIKQIPEDSVCRSAAVCAFTSVPADGYMLSYTCTSRWEVPIVEIVSQCPWTCIVYDLDKLWRLNVKVHRQSTSYTLQTREKWEGLPQ